MPAATPVRVVGVKRLADYLRRRADADPQLRNVSIRGEISNFSARSNGHVYFVLKEGEATLQCFAYERDAATFPPIVNGSAIVATGAVAVYSVKSTYQLIVRAVELEGVGQLHALLEERKRRLAADGVFAVERKRALPAFPFRVALVSSRNANGAGDFVGLLRKRAPHVAIVWCETSVQGPHAPAEIVAALGRASRADVDLIVVTRGGGSFEDLFAFSDESVVRAVARARHPVIAAIGHTADQQLCDFAADRHVETPSAAAEAIGADLRDLRSRIAGDVTRANGAVALRIERLRARLSGALLRSKLSEPRRYLAPLAQRLDALEDALAAAATAAGRTRARGLADLDRRLDQCDPSRRLAARATTLRSATHRLELAFDRRLQASSRARESTTARLEPALRGSFARAAQRLALAQRGLEGNNPVAILQRGYAIVTYDDAIVRAAADVPSGARVSAQVAHGTLFARVERNETDGNQRIG